jgi:heme exporter protein B
VTMLFFRTFYWIVKKDLLSEMRTVESVASTLVLALLLLLICGLAFGPVFGDLEKLAPGILWIAIVFSGTLGLSRIFALERENGCFRGLVMTPSNKGAVYLGKVASVFGLVIAIEIVVLPCFAVLFDYPVFRSFWPTISCFLLGSLGFSAVGALIATISSGTRRQEMLLSIVLFSLMVPVLISAVRSTGHLMGGGSLAEVSNWVRLLVVYDLVFLTVSFVLYDFVMEE